MNIPQHQFTKMRQCLWLYPLLLIVSAWSVNLYAQDSRDSTRYELTPYLWAASFAGSTVADGGESPPIDSDYSFFSLDNLDGVSSARFTAIKKPWGFLFDFMYVAFEDTFFEATPLQTTPRLEGLILEYAVSYAPRSFNNLDVIAGIRQQDIDVSLAILNQKQEGSADWFDPFVGLIYTQPLKRNFGIYIRGDVGGFGIESDLAVNAEVLLRYQFGNTVSAQFGYRYLKVDFSENNFVYDLTLDGFLFGLGLRF